MKRLLAAFLCGTFVCLYGGVCNSSEINGSEPFNLIEYCESHEIQSEYEFQRVLETYIDEPDNSSEDEYEDPVTPVSFELIIDYDNQFVITTSVYEFDSTRSTTSGYTSQKYYNNIGILVFEARVDATFSYNGSSCSTSSVTATFTPAPLSTWTSSPSASSGMSGSRAYGRAYGTAVSGSHSKFYSVYLYCDKSGNLSSS